MLNLEKYSQSGIGHFPYRHFLVWKIAWGTPSNEGISVVVILSTDPVRLG
ncbi:MAG: hypothetical protein HY785_26605 [Oscillatoriophycideae cyanobacterium NC_groundwater_1537_Pr4_S-0.65um_50_18]|nr:hypothetical protein [Oscillatoriophycideae cyanobacterium NC_groundwater_1537_Pr4_S-0.65um_50_18]